MPSWEQGDPARPPGAPIPGLHLPGDRSQSHSSLRPFRTAPFSPATVGGGPGPLQTRAEDGGAGLPLESLCPHFSVPVPPPGTCPYFPKSPVPSCSPGGASGHKALIILSSFLLNVGGPSPNQCSAQRYRVLPVGGQAPSKQGEGEVVEGGLRTPLTSAECGQLHLL